MSTDSAMKSSVHPFKYIHILLIALALIMGGVVLSTQAVDDPPPSEADATEAPQKPTSAKVRVTWNRAAGHQLADQLRARLSGRPEAAMADAQPAGISDGEGKQLPAGMDRQPAPMTGLNVMTVRVDADGQLVLSCVEGADRAREIVQTEAFESLDVAQVVVR